MKKTFAKNLNRGWTNTPRSTNTVFNHRAIKSSLRPGTQHDETFAAVFLPCARKRRYAVHGGPNTISVWLTTQATRIQSAGNGYLERGRLMTAIPHRSLWNPSHHQPKVKIDRWAFRNNASYILMDLAPCRQPICSPGLGRVRKIGFFSPHSPSGLSFLFQKSPAC